MMSIDYYLRYCIITYNTYKGLKMAKLEKASFNSKGNFFNHSLAIKSLEDFLNLSPNDFISFLKEKDLGNSYMLFLDEKIKIMIFISNDPQSIHHLKLQKTNPIKSLDLFDNENISNIKFNKLIDNHQKKQDFHLSLNGESYSFKILTNKAITPFISDISEYINLCIDNKKTKQVI